MEEFSKLNSIICEMGIEEIKNNFKKILKKGSCNYLVLKTTKKFSGHRKNIFAVDKWKFFRVITLYPCERGNICYPPRKIFHSVPSQSIVCYLS